MISSDSGLKQLLKTATVSILKTDVLPSTEPWNLNNNRNNLASTMTNR